jgi:hypothetical protein
MNCAGRPRVRDATDPWVSSVQVNPRIGSAIGITGGQRPGGPGKFSGMSEPARTLPIDAAAALVGVHAKTIRRWIARGHLVAATGPRGRLVDLAEVRRLATIRAPGPDTPEPARTLPDTDARTGRGLSELARALEIVDRLSRENLELAGRVGWLQSELEQSRQRIALLEAPEPEPVPRQRTESRGPDSPVQRPWWQFWRGWSRQPV